MDEWTARGCGGGGCDDSYSYRLGVLGAIWIHSSIYTLWSECCACVCVVAVVPLIGVLHDPAAAAAAMLLCAHDMLFQLARNRLFL
jgi:hypothetical protein